MPADFKAEVYEFIKKEFAKEKKENQTEEQFIYSTRKKGFGPFKKKWWGLQAEIKAGIIAELEKRFELLFEKLNVVNTKDIINKSISKTPVRKEIPETLKGLL